MELVKKIHAWFHRLTPKLNPEDLTEVQHYLDYDEWEMAFEILLINLIGSDLILQIEEVSELESIIEKCGIKKDGGIFDYEITEKFEVWKQAHIQN